MDETWTHGIDHLGLTVSSLQESVNFFVGCLKWVRKGERPEYPAVFVSDGNLRLTLWQASGDIVPFNRKSNIGLHHLALKVESVETLNALFSQVEAWPGVRVEFAPQLSGTGPKHHFMVFEPGGNRVEFAWDPRAH